MLNAKQRRAIRRDGRSALQKSIDRWRWKMAMREARVMMRDVGIRLALATEDAICG